MLSMQPTAHKHSPQAAFTLVELLVVIVIVGVLAGLVLTVINPGEIRARGRDTRRKSDIEIVRAAVEMYSLDQPNRTYPVGSGATGSPTNASYNQLATQLGGYLEVTLPQDPLNSGDYTYKYCVNNATTPRSYYLEAKIESRQAQNEGETVYRAGRGC